MALSPRCRGGGRSVALPGTCDPWEELGFMSPGHSKMHPGPSNSHIHTRADLGPHVSMSPAPPGRSCPSVRVVSCPMASFQGGDGSGNLAHTPFQAPPPGNSIPPSGDEFSTSHMGNSWANGNFWHWRAVALSHPPGP